MQRALGIDALHQSWVTTGLYGVQNLIGVTAKIEKAVFSLVAKQY